MHTLNCGGKLVALERPVVMGIINVTADSFFAGSRAAGVQAVVDKAGEMLDEGAFCIDLGGQSTRPGATTISASEEAAAVIPAVAEVARAFPGSIISVDTFYAQVAQLAVEAGARMVNDVSGGEADPDMLTLVGRLRVPYICMHSRGNAQTMQQLANYANLMSELLQWFTHKTYQCKAAGINDVIIDPGFGFAKTAAHNFNLLKHLQQLQIFDCPVLVGLSRKSTIFKTLGVTAAEALNGSTVAHTIALMHGAQILRVHDVREAMEAIKLVEATQSA